ncbi:hypothetical protein TruAng_004724 [Truncatella angustata]|nr:hypothetical protein TruAng_004724 [Truncatella angustata]
MFAMDVLVRQLGSSHFPCPGGNNNQIGDVQKFNALCGLDIGGVEIDRMQVDSLATCVSICTSHQAPRCDGVTFRMDNICIFKTGIATTSTQFQPIAGADSAIGLLPVPPPSSRCASLGTGMIQLMAAKNFNLQCGQIFAGNDIEQQFQPSFDDCLNACAAMPACGGISFDVQQSQGFRNCYLKTQITTGGLLARAGVDSAFVAVDNTVRPAPTAASITSLVPSQIATVVSEVGSGSSSNSVAGTTVASEPVSIQEAPQSTSLSLAGATTAPAASPEDPPSSTAWIAAPIIGSLAAIALLIGLCILRKRRGRAGNHSLSLFGRSRARDLDPRNPSRDSLKLDDEEAGGPTSARSSKDLGQNLSGNPRNSILVTRAVSREVEFMDAPAPRLSDNPFIHPIEIELDDFMDGKGTNGPRDSQNGLKLNGVSVHSTSKEKILSNLQDISEPVEMGKTGAKNNE